MALCSRVTLSGIHPLEIHRAAIIVVGKPRQDISLAALNLDKSSLSKHAHLEPIQTRGDSAAARSVLLARSKLAMAPHIVQVVQKARQTTTRDRSRWTHVSSATLGLTQLSAPHPVLTVLPARSKRVNAQPSAKLV